MNTKYQLVWCNITELKKEFILSELMLRGSILLHIAEEKLKSNKSVFVATWRSFGLAPRGVHHDTNRQEKYDTMWVGGWEHGDSNYTTEHIVAMAIETLE